MTHFWRVRGHVTGPRSCWRCGATEGTPGLGPDCYAGLECACCGAAPGTLCDPAPHDAHDNTAPVAYERPALQAFGALPDMPNRSLMRLAASLLDGNAGGAADAAIANELRVRARDLDRTEELREALLSDVPRVSVRIVDSTSVPGELSLRLASAPPHRGAGALCAALKPAGFKAGDVATLVLAVRT